MLVSKSNTLFRGTKFLENQIDEFLDRTMEAGLIFLLAIKIYLEDGACEEFEESLRQVSEIESRGDKLRKGIETQLYERTLIPDLRGDVLSLLEEMDELINVVQANFYRFSIETPEIPVEYHRDFMNLTEMVIACVESAVMGARAFFRNIEAVRDHILKVNVLETEADKICTKLKREVFASDLPKVDKIHLRYFIERIDLLANVAEDIADHLAIFTIKRTL